MDNKDFETKGILFINVDEIKNYCLWNIADHIKDLLIDNISLFDKIRFIIDNKVLDIWINVSMRLQAKENSIQAIKKEFKSYYGYNFSYLNNIL